MLSKAVCLRCLVDYLSEKEFMCIGLTDKRTGKEIPIETQIQKLKDKGITCETCARATFDYKMKAPKKGMPKKCPYALEQTVQQ